MAEQAENRLANTKAELGLLNPMEKRKMLQVSRKLAGGQAEYARVPFADVGHRETRVRADGHRNSGPAYLLEVLDCRIELLARDRHHKIDVLFSPMIYSLPSYLNGHEVASLACPPRMPNCAI